MSKYTNLTKTILGIFGTPEWAAENVKTYPGDFVAVASTNEYIRVHVLPGGPGLNPFSVSGQVLIDIFTPAGGGPLKAAQIADKLDAHLVGECKQIDGATIQFPESSSLVHRGKDAVNPALQRSQYALNVSYFGV